MELRHKLHSGLRLWEFPDQYVIEPTDGSSAPCLDISRLDGSMKLIGAFSLAFLSFLICSMHPLLCFRSSRRMQLFACPQNPFHFWCGWDAEAPRRYSNQTVKCEPMSCGTNTTFLFFLKTVSGSYLVVVTESESVGSFLGHPIFRINSLNVLPCDHSLKTSPEEQVFHFSSRIYIRITMELKSQITIPLFAEKD